MQLLKVEGMKCGHCIKAITEVIKAADTQARVEVDLTSAEVRVQSVLAAGQLATLINSVGYSAQAQ